MQTFSFSGQHVCVAASGRVPVKKLFPWGTKKDTIPPLTIVADPDQPALIVFPENVSPLPPEIAPLAAIFSATAAVDGSGRLQIGQQNLNHIKLGRSGKVVLVGKESFFLIWGEDQWKQQGLPAYRAEFSQRLSALPLLAHRHA
ncbi:MAG: hypothetical protein KDJ15_03010 [Alphaproteobacteria bacterium]|nr:hypothetical protein [Alphaproteobacteria bacterium]